MNLPFFYLDNLFTDRLTLNEETSKHIVAVLRMQNGEHVLLTDGKGRKVTATIIDNRSKDELSVR